MSVNAAPATRQPEQTNKNYDTTLGYLFSNGRIITRVVRSRCVRTPAHNTNTGSRPLCCYVSDRHTIATAACLQLLLLLLHLHIIFVRVHNRSQPSRLYENFGTWLCGTLLFRFAEHGGNEFSSLLAPCTSWVLHRTQMRCERMILTCTSWSSATTTRTREYKYWCVVCVILSIDPFVKSETGSISRRIDANPHTYI